MQVRHCRYVCLSQLTVCTNLRLAEDSDRQVREQAIILLQNTTIKDQDIAFTVDNLGAERLMRLLQQAMSSSDPGVVEHVSLSKLRLK
jgi:hypothetical protein